MIDPRCLPVAVLGLFLLTAAPVSAEAQTPTAATLRITSPLGRTGLTGTIRIVARLDADGGHAPRQVDFYVDKLLLASDLDGPPYEALWGDDNPFERRELTARAEFDAGPALTSTVVLPPLQVAEAAEVTSVALEASVVNARGSSCAASRPRTSPCSRTATRSRSTSWRRSGNRRCSPCWSTAARAWRCAPMP
jgi:hypothetical protein